MLSFCQSIMLSSVLVTVSLLLLALHMYGNIPPMYRFQQLQASCTNERYSVGFYGSNTFAIIIEKDSEELPLPRGRKYKELRKVLKEISSNDDEGHETLWFTIREEEISLPYKNRIYEFSDPGLAKPLKDVLSNRLCEQLENKLFLFPHEILAAVTLITLVAAGVFTRGSTVTLQVKDVRIYPIKGCAPQIVRRAKVTPMGLENDRTMMVIDKRGSVCTGRHVDKARLLYVQPHLQEENYLLTLTASDGDANGDSMASLTVDLKASSVLGKEKKIIKAKHNEAPHPVDVVDCGGKAVREWLSRATGIPSCRLVRIGSEYRRWVLMNEHQGEAVPMDQAPLSLADEAPLLLTNVGSLNDLNNRLERRGKPTIDMRRFRPNLVVKTTAWQEDCWRKIRIGQVEFWVWQRCGRCTMTTIDCDTLQRSGEPLSTLRLYREIKGQRNFGVHLIPDPASLKGAKTKPTIGVGDSIEVLEYHSKRQKQLQAQLVG